jgi:type I restriction enzyme S subunit
VRFIRSQNVPWGSCDFSDAAFISEETHTEMNRSEVKQWDVFLNITGASIGRSAIYTEAEKANVNQHVAILRPTEKLLPAFLTRYLISEGVQSQIRTIQSGASREALNYQQIKELEIPLPPLEEQRRIVAEIEGYQKVLDGARQILAGYKPTLEVPPDWTVVKLGEACEKIMDGTHFSPKNNSEGKYRYITAKNVKEMRLSLDDVTFISEEAHREIYRRCPVKKGDVLYIKDGATTGIAALNPLEEEFSLLSSVAVLRGKKDVLDDRFLAYYFNSPQGKSYLLGMVSGVAITRLTLTKLNDAEIPLPPLAEQRRIVAELDAEAAQMEAVRALLPRFEAKIQRVLDRVWGNGLE